MCNFLDVMKSELFWSALAAIATFLAVLVALFLPKWQERQKEKAIKDLITSELGSNIEIFNQTLRYLEPSYREKLMQHIGHPIESIMIAEIKRLSFLVWDRHWERYSLLNPDNFLRLSSQVKDLNDLLRLSNGPPQGFPNEAWYPLFAHKVKEVAMRFIEQGLTQEEMRGHCEIEVSASAGHPISK